MPKMSKWQFFLIFVLGLSPVLAFGDSSRVIISGQEDAFVDESNFIDQPPSSLMTGFGGTRTEFIFTEEKNNRPTVISNKILPITSYLKFDLRDIPSSTLFETVSIEDSKLQLFFTIPDDSDATKYVFTVSYCPNNNWTEDNLTWNTQPCKENLKPIDSTVISEEDSPGFVELDIVEAINHAKEKRESKITLALNADPFLFKVKYNESNIGKVTKFIQNKWNEIQMSDFSVNNKPLPENNFQGRAELEFRGIWNDYLADKLLYMDYIDVNFIDAKLYSLSYSVANSHLIHIESLESKELGHAFWPTIIVNYNIGPSVFNDSIIFMLTVILPTLTIIVPVFVWMYKKSKD